MSVPLQRIVDYCQKRLRVEEIADYDGAHNGLQVGKRGPVRRIAAAVDASAATVHKAAEQGADLLVVHHGLFWAPQHPWTGRRYELFRLLVERDMAVYSVHLPLDAHPVLGNNAILFRRLGLQKRTPFFHEKGTALGWKGTTRLSLEELVRRLERVVEGPVRLLAGNPRRCSQVGVVSGGAGSGLKQAAAEGVDTFITGEGPHWTFTAAEDLGLNVLYGGHYATETFGVRALAGELSEKFGLPWGFVDHPSGL